MLFLTLEDLTGSMDAIAFPNVYRLAKDVFSFAGIEKHLRLFDHQFP